MAVGDIRSPWTAPSSVRGLRAEQFRHGTTVFTARSLAYIGIAARLSGARLSSVREVVSGNPAQRGLRNSRNCEEFHQP